MEEVTFRWASQIFHMWNGERRCRTEHMTKALGVGKHRMVKSEES